MVSDDNPTAEQAYVPEVITVRLGEEIYLGKDFLITPVKFSPDAVNFIYRISSSSALNRMTITLGQTMRIISDVKLRPLEFLGEQEFSLLIHAPRYGVKCERQIAPNPRKPTITVKKSKAQTISGLEAQTTAQEKKKHD